MAAQQKRRQCILDSAVLAAAATTGVASHSAMAAKAMDNDASRQALVQEGLRWAAPAALLPQMCSADTSLGGVDIAAGD